MKYLFITITSLALFACGGEEKSENNKDSELKDKVCECVTLVDQMRKDQKAAEGDLDKVDEIMKKNQDKLVECRKFEEEIREMPDDKRKEIEALAKDCK